MIPKLKTKTFIDTLVFDLADNSTLCATLRDDEGKICNKLETEVIAGLTTFRWGGFNDLPYGEYTLELTNENETKLLSLVKRV